MTSVRIIKHESVPQSGSYEVKFTDGGPSVFHYFDDNAGRQSITGKMTGAQRPSRPPRNLRELSRASSIRNNVLRAPS